MKYFLDDFVCANVLVKLTMIFFVLCEFAMVTTGGVVGKELGGVI